MEYPTLGTSLSNSKQPEQRFGSIWNIHKCNHNHTHTHTLVAQRHLKCEMHNAKAVSSISIMCKLQNKQSVLIRKVERCWTRWNTRNLKDLFGMMAMLWPFQLPLASLSASFFLARSLRLLQMNRFSTNRKCAIFSLFISLCKMQQNRAKSVLLETEYQVTETNSRGPSPLQSLN